MVQMSPKITEKLKEVDPCQLLATFHIMLQYVSWTHIVSSIFSCYFPTKLNSVILGLKLHAMPVLPLSVENAITLVSISTSTTQAFIQACS